MLQEYELSETLQRKIDRAKEVIKEAIGKKPNMAIACSFGKDSMVVLDIAKKINKDLPVFAVMTPYKPEESFTYIKEMDEQLDLNVVVHFAGKEAPEELKFLEDRLILYPDLAELSDKYGTELNDYLKNNESDEELPLHEICPSLCCDIFKTEVIKRALIPYDGWICGLRRDEGTTRIHYKEIENKNELIKVNPIIDFTEDEVFEYLKMNNIPLHPWYYKEFPDGKRYRSLGCEPCTIPIYSDQKERAGRWAHTKKCGGECGIHTRILRLGKFTRNNNG